MINDLQNSDFGELRCNRSTETYRANEIYIKIKL